MYLYTFLFSAASTRYMRLTTLYLASTVFIEPTITVSVLEQSYAFDTLEGRLHPVATDLASPLTPLQFNTPLVIGVVK